MLPGSPPPIRSLPPASQGKEGRKLPRACPSGAPGQGKGAEACCWAGGLAQTQPLACMPVKDEAAGGMVLEGLGRSCWAHASALCRGASSPTDRRRTVSSHPCRPPRGLHHVFVGKGPAGREGAMQGDRAGVLLRGPSAPGPAAAFPSAELTLPPRFRWPQPAQPPPHHQPTPPHSLLQHAGDAQPGKGPWVKQQLTAAAPISPSFCSGSREGGIHRGQSKQQPHRHGEETPLQIFPT